MRTESFVFAIVEFRSFSPLSWTGGRFASYSTALHVTFRIHYIVCRRLLRFPFLGSHSIDIEKDIEFMKKSIKLKFFRFRRKPLLITLS